ncbi:VOC family protein [Nocardiopsis sp. RSe5-2]|uniref:VOC family protein n=1 Tax=Nocardiopsis endophytica TaxID=3018445 RepID=A0ABT4TZZ9_9ACTN|nr:VOC family protein [Nocardiopsis endophytica]MDA2810256.1 VOC family protein [Nocardiopsis endophytica]
MAIQRMDHVSIVVGDIEAATAYFVELGMEVEGAMPIDAEWAGRVVGIEGMRSEVTMLRTPDGNGKIELARYRAPEAAVPEPGPSQPNVIGMRTVMFAVDDIEDTVERLRGHGGELVGEIADFEDVYRLCYMTGPEGVIIALAQELR